MKPKRANLIWIIVVNAVYAAAAIFGWPVYLFLLATRRKYRANLAERWGLVPRLADTRVALAARPPVSASDSTGCKQPVAPPEAGRRRFWVHAISVGEAEAARTIVPALAAAYPDADIVISTTTLTGRQRAQKLFPGRTVFHFPLDLAPCVLLALGRIRPTAVIQVESEWWPNFFLLAARRGVPVLCVNVRITEKGQRGYRRIRRLMAAVFNSTAAIGVQADIYKERLLALGADADRLRLTGQMKHDGVTFTDHVPGAEDLGRDVGLSPQDPIFVAGCTAPGEDETLLAAWRDARRAFPTLRLVMVPRRPENFEAAAEAIRTAGCGLVRRSRPDGEVGGDGLIPPVILGDTMGELMKWYALATVVFVGRSLVPLGGSNPMEPGSLGKPLLWGPEMFNFPIEAPALVAAGAAREVRSSTDLSVALVDLLTHAERRRQMGEAARQQIRSMQGATARNIDLVREALSEM
jgi:3-deoxy-D-manno-octulosonic-acid transferase